MATASPLEVAPSAYFVKCAGLGTCAFELPQQNRTVGGLVAAVAARQGLDTSTHGNGADRSEPPLRLAWNGKTLWADGVNSNGGGDVSPGGEQPLEDLGVHPGATLEVVHVLKGGAQCGKMVKGRSKEKADGAGDLAAKMRWLQEQAAKRLAARDALKAMRDKADYEHNMSKKNQLKLMAALRDMMREDKLAELKRDLEGLAATHAAAVERKDALIQRLLDNLAFAYDQHSAAAHAHLEHLEQLIRLQDQRLLLAERQFEADLKVLVDEFDDERDEVVAKHAEENAELEAIYNAIEASERSDEDEALAELQTLKQECREKREDAIDDLRSVLDGRLETIQDAFETAHLEYLERTDKRVSDFKHYTRVNREREKDIERCVRTIERLQLSMLEVRNNMQLSNTKFEEQRLQLVQEKAAVQEQVTALREKMRKFQSGQKSRRAALASSADKAKNTLAEHVALAERVLALGAMARKKENERELVLPFATSSSEADQLDAEVAEGGEVDPSLTVTEATHALSNFHKKYNAALAEKLTVENERRRLRDENEQLMGLLKQVQDGLIVNDEVLASDNPLFVVNGRSNVGGMASTQAVEPLPVERKAAKTLNASSTFAQSGPGEQIQQVM